MVVEKYNSYEYLQERFSMNSFTNDTKGYEEYLAYKAFKIFFDSYLIDRDYEKTICSEGNETA